MIPVGVVGKRGRSNRVAELIPQVSVRKHGSVFCDGNFVTGKIRAADKRSVFFEKMKITVVGYGKIAVWHKGQTATMGTVTKAELTGSAARRSEFSFDGTIAVQNNDFHGLGIDDEEVSAVRADSDRLGFGKTSG